jgi:tRNA1Val (adenine37-N6)-methyltransferase
MTIDSRRETREADLTPSPFPEGKGGRSETRDTILSGALTILQPAAGYRFSIDSILLGNFAKPRMSDRVLDLGCGCGVIAAMIAIMRRPRTIVGIELQPELVELARHNATLNQLANMSVIEGNLRDRKIPGVDAGTFDYIVANPPYRAARDGHESPHLGRRIARGDGGASLRDFVGAARRYATGDGKIAIIFTAIRTAELIAELKAHALEPKRMRLVHPYADDVASVVMVEARKGGGVEVKIEAPLVLWERPGQYSAEARSILNGDEARAVALTPR